MAPNRKILTTPAWLSDTRPPQVTPWAILLCQYNDTIYPSPTPDVLYQDLFTTTGDGTFNSLRYFSDVSHGRVDLSGSQVFGPILVDAFYHDYTAPEPTPPGWMQTLNRVQLTTRVRQAALNAGVPLQNFFGDVIIFNVAIGIPFGSTGIPYSGAPGNRPYACSDFRSTSTSVFGHEMAHAYGLDHSRLDGTVADYTDRWDMMSALNTWQGVDPNYGTRGPGINAANMRALEWLNPARVWRPASASSFSSVIQLRPLFRRDLPGLLTADLAVPDHDGFTVEYRKRSDWDSGIPRSTVMVHRYLAGHSYLMSSGSGRIDLQKGNRFDSYSGNLPYVANVAVEVLNIDDAGDVATVRVSRTPGQPLPHTIPTHVLGQVPFDGPGIILKNGRVVPIPPWNPMAQVLERIAELPEGEDAAQRYARDQLKRQMLMEIAGDINRMIEEIDSFGGPDPMLKPFFTERKARKRRTPAARTGKKTRRQ
jgi:hypothetical protein